MNYEGNTISDYRLVYSYDLNQDNQTASELLNIVPDVLFGEKLDNAEIYSYEHRLDYTYKDYEYNYIGSFENGEKLDDGEELDGEFKPADSKFYYFDGKELYHLIANNSNNNNENNRYILSEDYKFIDGLYYVVKDKLAYSYTIEPNIIVDQYVRPNTDFYYDIDSKRFYVIDKNIWSAEVPKDNFIELEQGYIESLINYNSFDVLQDKYQFYKAEIKDKNLLLKNKQKELADKKEELATIEKEKNSLEQKNDINISEYERYNELNSQYSILKREIDSLNDAIDSLSEDIDSLNSSMKELQDNAEEEIKKQIEEHNKLYEELLAKPPEEE